MTQLLVLALLDMRSMSGYDIKQMMEQSHIERWSGVMVGSIYHALKVLDNSGYIEIVNIEQTGHRQKAVYQITSNGRIHLKELITDSLKTPCLVYPSFLYSGMSFINKLSDIEAKEALLEQEKLLDKEFNELRAGLKKKSEVSNNQLPPMIKLIFENMFDTVELNRRFVKSALSLLES